MQFEALLSFPCKHIFKSQFAKGETILSVTEHTGRGGILEHGNAHVSCFDEKGNETIVAILDTGECFGEFFIDPTDSNNYFVIADSPCAISFVHINSIISGCDQMCSNHKSLMNTLFLMSLRHTQKLNLHLSIMSKRTIRDKLLTYLKYNEFFSPASDVIEIPTSLVVLANFLCVDRSAMMREIQKMNSEGIIRSKGRHFTIL